MKDLGKTQRDYAIFLPAISSFYVKQLEKLQKEGAPRIPEGLELGHEGMDFLKDKDTYYYYPWGLYSAGHAQLDLDKLDGEPMITDRNRSKTLILGDSGGFQIATGVIKMDWANAINPNDPEREKLVNKILKWEEEQCDWAMTLDVPPFAAFPPFNKKTGLETFEQTMQISLYNLDYYMKNRTLGKCKFLNVMSGVDEPTCHEWYEKVKHFSDPKFCKEAYGNSELALEGYAFADLQKRNMRMALRRILKLREDGLLEGKGWIHFLGTGKLNWACYLTSIQRMLRKHDSPDICLSMDAASPFVNSAYGSTYTHNSFHPKKFSYLMDRAIDNQQLKGSKLPMPFAHSPIMERLTVGDICAMAEGDLDKNGKAKSATSTSWDTQTYLYYMAHSVYNHITAVQEANRLADVEKYRTNIHYTDYINDKKSGKSNEFSPYVPANALYFDSFCQEVLDPACPNPYELIEENVKLLDEMSFGAKTNAGFGAFFEEEEFDQDDDVNAMTHEIMSGDFEA